MASSRIKQDSNWNRVVGTPYNHGKPEDGVESLFPSEGSKVLRWKYAWHFLKKAYLAGAWGTAEEWREVRSKI